MAGDVANAISAAAPAVFLNCFNIVAITAMLQFGQNTPFGVYSCKNHANFVKRLFSMGWKVRESRLLNIPTVFPAGFWPKLSENRRKLFIYNKLVEFKGEFASVKYSDTRVL